MRDTEPEIGITKLCNIECRLRHIIAEIQAVSTRISDELALIERLRIVECLLRRIAESLVCFSLERGQVIQLRSFIGLDLTLDRADSDLTAVTGRNKRISGIFIVNSCRRKNEPTAIQVSGKILLLHKGGGSMAAKKNVVVTPAFTGRNVSLLDRLANGNAPQHRPSLRSGKF